MKVVTFAPVSKCTHTKGEREKNKQINSYEALTTVGNTACVIIHFYTLKQYYQNCTKCEGSIHLRHQSVCHNKNKDVLVFKNNLYLFFPT